MPDRRKNASPEFGGQWTLEKLQILERYLDAYTTALKDKPFKLWYIDAFAGSGSIKIPDGGEEAYLFSSGDEEARGFVEGSAALAIEIRDKPFDKFVFVEKDTFRCDELRNLAKNYPDRDISIENAEANEYLAGIDDDWTGRRGVLFLDPYATAVEWTTIEKIARLEALDTWILFPTAALSRMLPRERMPEDVHPRWAEHLTKIYGGKSWEDLYQPTPDLFPDLFEETLIQRQPGGGGALSIYKRNLENLFGDRFLNKSRPLVNSKNSVLFEFIFCAGHPKGTRIAHRIARHLIKSL